MKLKIIATLLILFAVAFFSLVPVKSTEGKKLRVEPIEGKKLKVEPAEDREPKAKPTEDEKLKVELAKDKKVKMKPVEAKKPKAKTIKDKKVKVKSAEKVTNITSEVATSTDTLSAAKAKEKQISSRPTADLVHEQMLQWDSKFDSLSKHNKAKFIRYWVSYYSKSLGVSTSRINGSKAVGIAISETSLGTAGVGRSKNNIFGCKIDSNGKFVSSFPRFSNHRLSVKALVQFYKQHSEWRLWKNKYSTLGL